MMNPANIKNVVIVLVTMSASALGCADTPIPVYLLAGQSNMGGVANSADLPAALQGPQSDVKFYHNSAPTVTPQGTWAALEPGKTFGPEISFGRKMADTLGREVVLIKYAFGGTDLYEHWRAPTENDPNSGFLYDRFILEIKKALSEIDRPYKIAGMLWQQGEKDSRDDGQHKVAVYEQRLTDLINAVRREFDDPELPFIFGYVSELENTVFSPKHNYPYAHLIRRAQYNVSQKMDHVVLIQTNDLTFNEDKKHYDAAAQIKLGQRFADALLAPKSASR